jgi:hypothetical protein
MARKNQDCPHWTGADVAAVIVSACNGVAAVIDALSHVHW